MTKTQFFVTADDRTGALEVGGIVANEVFTVPVGPLAENNKCCVVDLDSRQLLPGEAADRTARAHERQAVHRCHKMDSGLRGNWPYEVQALTALGYDVAIVASFPDAGRRCKDGVVYIQDVPVLESPFASDPLTSPVSSRPVEVLEHAGCLNDHICVWDANDNDELKAAAVRCYREGRILVGPAGAIGAYADIIFPNRLPRRQEIPLPVLMVCGSLNATSREQISKLQWPQFGLTENVDLSTGRALLASPMVEGEVTAAAAAEVAQVIATRVHELRHEIATLIVIGGDTVAAIVGDDSLEVLGTVATGIPISRFQGQLLITKGGGIGTGDTLLDLVGRYPVDAGAQRRNKSYEAR